MASHNEKYTLITENIYAWLPTKSDNQKKTNLQNNKNPKSIDNKDSNSDSLFWLFYCLIYGEHEYELNRGFKAEKDFKIKCIENLRTIKGKIKEYKLKLSSIEDTLLNAKKIDIKAFLGLCLLFNKNIIYVWDRKFYEFYCSKDEDIYVITNQDNEFTCDKNSSKIQFYKDNYFQIENLDKPLKAISGYIRDDLLTITKKLEIKDISAKATKKELYEKIIQKF